MVRKVVKKIAGFMFVIALVILGYSAISQGLEFLHALPKLVFTMVAFVFFGTLTFIGIVALIIYFVAKDADKRQHRRLNELNKVKEEEHERVRRVRMEDL